MKKTLLKTIIIAIIFATNANAQNSLNGWGSNSWGALGNGATFGSTMSPTKIGNDNWNAIDGGLGFSVGIKSDGTLWSWGKNNNNELGNGTKTDKTTPQQISSNTNWKTLSVGSNHTCLIKSDSTLWGFGEGYSGSFGNGLDTNLTTPTQIGGGTADWKAVAAGYYYTLALKTNGTLWAWGYNNHGQVGNGKTTDAYSPIQIGTDTNWKMIAAGSYYSFAIKTDGTLWSWGWGYNNLGLGNVKTPTQVGTDSNWKFVASLDDSHFAIKTDGTLWAWGDNIAGQLGVGNNTATINTITQVGTDTNWESVTPGTDMSIMMKSDHTIWGTGQGILNGLSASTNTPSQIGTESSWVSIASGSTQSFALKSSVALGINDNLTLSNSILLSPNPAKDFVTISNIPSGSIVTILDITGKVLYSPTTTNEQTTINTTGFTNGIYLIRVDNNGNSTNKKLIINK